MKKNEKIKTARSAPPPLWHSGGEPVGRVPGRWLACIALLAPTRQTASCGRLPPTAFQPDCHSRQRCPARRLARPTQQSLMVSSKIEDHQNKKMNRLNG